MDPGACSVLADLRLECGVGTCSPPSVNPGPQVIPALGMLFLFRFIAELEFFLLPKVPLSLPISSCGSSIVLEGDPGVGGVCDRDDLRVVNVKVAGRLFDSWDGARARGALRGSVGTACWSTTFSTRELVRLRKLVAFLKTPGLLSFVEGDEDSTGLTFVMLILLLVRRERITGAARGGCSIVGLCERELMNCFGGFTFAVWIGIRGGGAGVLRSMVLASGDGAGKRLSNWSLLVFMYKNRCESQPVGVSGSTFPSLPSVLWFSSELVVSSGMASCTGSMSSMLDRMGREREFEEFEEYAEEGDLGVVGWGVEELANKAGGRDGKIVAAITMQVVASQAG